MDKVDDKELDRLEKLRRYGYPDGRTYDQEYYQLPPSKSKLIRAWTEWRIQKNTQMITGICNSKNHSCFRTIPLYEKIPNFFKSQTGFYAGQRLKDDYGGEAIREDDSPQTRHEKEIMDENFFLFGIPRVSLSKLSKRKINISDIPDPPVTTGLDGMNVSSIIDSDDDGTIKQTEDSSKTKPTRTSSNTETDHATKEEIPNQDINTNSAHVDEEEDEAPLYSLHDLDERGAMAIKPSIHMTRF